MSVTGLNNGNLSPSSTFISGEEHAEKIGHYINCSSNPYDLRPAADIILGAAYEMAKSLPREQPIAIVFGEPHSMPSRIRLQNLVASRLHADNQAMTVNVEFDHNYWSLLAKHGLGKEVPSELSYAPHDYDPKGQALLSAFLSVGGFGGTPVSFDNLMAFCRDKKIPTIFNEAARDEECNLDMQDAFTASLTRRFLDTENVEGLKLHRSNQEDVPTCMAIANLAMAELGVEYAKANEAKFILQQAGLNHVFGTVESDCSFEHSLTRTYLEAGAAVLPVFSTIKTGDYGLNIFPESAYGALGQSVVIDGLAEETFSWADKAAEKDFIKDKLDGNSGNDLEFYDVEARKDEYKKLASDDADKLIRRYEEFRKRKMAPRAGFEPATN